MPDDQPSPDTSYFKKHQLSIVLAALAGIAICLLAGWQFKPADPVIAQKTGIAVFAIHGIDQGQVIGMNDIEEREIPLADIPADGVMKSSSIIGAYARNSIVKGHPIQMSDTMFP